ncbi:protein RER1B-like [Senna tora]|uniref:Protein RER1B-like n=1 Tax=Senna tora TaxID=362788 RepID=A0A834WQD1_9FABA|nr:protein RER1B-like [Senna tora]
MEGGGGDAPSTVAPLAQWRNDFSRAFHYYLDRSTPHTGQRWLGTLAVAAIYVLRVYYVRGFYVVSYGLGIYILNLLIGFMSPKVDPELEVLDGASLPTKDSDEFKPFVRRLPEFKFWYSITKAFCVAFLMTFISVLDVPVFWPILLCYWFVLFILTMKRQIMHMIKYKYVPVDIGKKEFPKFKVLDAFTFPVFKSLDIGAFLCCQDMEKRMEEGEVVKDRRMMGPYIENHITKTSNLITKATPAVTLVVAAEDLAPAPALAPTASASLGSGRANLTASYHIHNHTLGNNKSDDGVTLMSPREHLKQAKILSTTS